jgi:hypothetical protein
MARWCYIHRACWAKADASRVAASMLTSSLLSRMSRPQAKLRSARVANKMRDRLQARPNAQIGPASHGHCQSVALTEQWAAQTTTTTCTRTASGHHSRCTEYQRTARLSEAAFDRLLPTFARLVAHTSSGTPGTGLGTAALPACLHSCAPLSHMVVRSALTVSVTKS